MKRLYEANQIWFAVAWIIAYCVLMSLGDALSAAAGIEKSVTLAVALCLSAGLLLFLKRGGFMENYGLCPARVSARAMLYYIPILLMFSVNLWYGVTCRSGILETLLYIMTMLCVGFLEEVIFRGLLFEAIRRESTKAAVIVSSITFGIGHILNLVNGSGAELLPNLLQVLYATAAGFLFVMMYLKTGSLLGCIVSHGIFNALSVFSDEGNATPQLQILSALSLTLITGSYAVYLARSLKSS